jgi:hypothetical protein
MKAHEYRKKRQEEEATADVTLPSGAVFKMRRPPLEVWAATGRIPQSFLRAMLDAQEAGSASNINLTTEETLDGFSFVAEAIVYACVEPRVGVKPNNEDILDLAELDPADFAFLTRWVQSNAPDVPVRTAGGELELNKLQRFRQKQPGGGNAGLGADGEAILDAAELAAAV